MPWEDAQKLLPKAIIKMSKEEREKRLRDIWDHIDEVPTGWGVTLVSCHLEDMVAGEQTKETIEHLVESLWLEEIEGQPRAVKTCRSLRCASSS